MLKWQVPEPCFSETKEPEAYGHCPALAGGGAAFDDFAAWWSYAKDS